MYSVYISDSPKAALRHQKGHRLWFDVSQVPVGESIVAAELRVFRRHADPTRGHNEKYSIMLSQLFHRPEGYVIAYLFLLKLFLTKLNICPIQGGFT